MTSEDVAVAQMHANTKTKLGYRKADIGVSSNGVPRDISLVLLE